MKDWKKTLISPETLIIDVIRIIDASALQIALVLDKNSRLVGVITDGDIAVASRNGTMDHREHPGLLRTTGHIGFLGHGSVVKFRNIRVKEL